VKSNAIIQLLRFRKFYNAAGRVKFVLVSLPLPVEEHCLKYHEIVVSDQIPFHSLSFLTGKE
jgi:hypothetical protein